MTGEIEKFKLLQIVEGKCLDCDSNLMIIKADGNYYCKKCGKKYITLKKALQELRDYKPLTGEYTE